jgi:hypothetical protein
MPRFLKKQIEIEAIQFTGNNYKELERFAEGGFRLVDKLDREDDPEITAEVWDKLHSTWVGVKNGHYIIKGIIGEFYPCDDNVFFGTYDELKDVIV